MMRTLHLIARTAAPVICLLLCWLPLHSFAQWQLPESSYSYERSVDRPFPLMRNLGPDTLLISESQPFRDDFSNRDGRPDTSNWYTPTSFFDVPVLTYGMAVSPPTQGVLTFDGIARNGEPYARNGLISGLADRLFSQCIDLSSYSPADKLVLSFALQPQGRGDAPEPGDMFQVLFKTQENPPNDYVEVLSVNGSSLESFRFYSIRLDDPAFFHDCFQMAFQSRGSLSVPADHWHLDYVYLAPNRELSDTAFVDVSPSMILSSPLAPYSAMPVNQFNRGSNLTDFAIEVHNNASDMLNVPYELRLYDPRGFNNWTGNDTQSGADLLSSKSFAPYAFSGFSSQTFSKNGAVALELITQTPADEYPSNDTFRTSFRVDSLWAYDDGEADGVFGLNRQLGYGIQLDSREADSISAVWIHFEPLVHVNTINGTVTYMKDQNFRLVIWNKAHPDSILASRIHQVMYGPDNRAYIRYAFSQPVEIPGTCWIGVQQMSKLPLGLGIDRTFDNKNFMYYDSLGTWASLGINGSLMIRPETYQGGQFTSDLQEEKLSLQQASIYPNPSQDRQVFLQLPTEQSATKLILRNLHGQLVYTDKLVKTGLIKLPDDLRSGLYIWQITLADGRTQLIKWQYSAN